MQQSCGENQTDLDLYQGFFIVKLFFIIIIT